MLCKRTPYNLGNLLVFDDAIADVLPDLEATPFHCLCPPCPPSIMMRRWEYFLTFSLLVSTRSSVVEKEETPKTPHLPGMWGNFFGLGLFAEVFPNCRLVWRVWRVGYLREVTPLRKDPRS
jgi:hypothetical protein